MVAPTTTLLPVRTVLKVIGAMKVAFDKWLPGAKDAVAQLAGGDAGEFETMKSALLAPYTLGHLDSAVLRAHGASWADFSHSVGVYRGTVLGEDGQVRALPCAARSGLASSSVGWFLATPLGMRKSAQQQAHEEALLVTSAYIKHVAHCAKHVDGITCAGKEAIMRPEPMLEALGACEIVAHAWLVRATASYQHLPHATFQERMAEARGAAMPSSLAESAVGNMRYCSFRLSLGCYVDQPGWLEEALDLDDTLLLSMGTDTKPFQMLGKEQVASVKHAFEQACTRIDGHYMAAVEAHHPCDHIGFRAGGTSRSRPELVVGLDKALFQMTLDRGVVWHGCRCGMVANVLFSMARSAVSGLVSRVAACKMMSESDDDDDDEFSDLEKLIL